MALNADDVLAGLARIVSEEADDIAEADVLLEKNFADDLDIDSLTMMTIITVAEGEFDVTIPDDEAKNLVTVGDAVNFIVKASA